MKNLFILIFIAAAILYSCKSATRDSQNDLSEESEWISLFDGKTLNGWRSFNSDTIGGWVVENGYLTALGEGSDLSGDIVSVDEFENFELYLEWKISPGGNSGVMFRVVEGYATTYATGPEYQLLDDEGFPSPLEDWQKAGANYAMHVARNKTLKPVGEFNTTRIIVDGPHVEHWLNGEKILEYELWSDEWTELKENGKWKDYPDYGMAKKGHIALQDHGDNVWFRDVRIRPILK
ncbi:MAG: DUF1080 domain-containing protein [Bacteroidales bacterium]|nr:DUF1080 domain-containing protein [Bacteroidales bacterium]